MKRIVHFTSVHPCFDTRIFLKECVSLVQAGYDVSLIAPCEENKIEQGVKVIGFPRAKNRVGRFFLSFFHVLKLAIKQKADAYHFHDPELIFAGIILKVLGYKVIYDVHEDYSSVLLHREWIPYWMRKILSKSWSLIEFFVSKRFNLVVAATPKIASLFHSQNTIIAQNFPRLQVMESKNSDYETRENIVIYHGGLTVERGSLEMIESINYVRPNLNATLLLIGKLDQNTKTKLENVDQQNIQYLEWMDQQKLAFFLQKAKIGLVTLHPNQSYIVSLPTKMFEYMAAGLPFVASNFPLWRQFLETPYGPCGVCVDPLNPKEIGQALTYLLEHPEEAKKMGEAGQRMVKEKYNWENEEKVLMKAYARL